MTNPNYDFISSAILLSWVYGVEGFVNLVRVYTLSFGNLE